MLKRTLGIALTMMSLSLAAQTQAMGQFDFERQKL